MPRWKVTGYRDYRIHFECVVEAENEEAAEEKALGSDWQEGTEEDFVNCDANEEQVETCERRS